jgi:DNA-binding PadR family transcriptional regulator
MDILNRTEEVYLLSIWELKENAYGVTIKKKVSGKTGKLLSYGGLYFTLDQLVKKRLVIKKAGEPSHIRGGRSKNFYTLTEFGRESLRATFEYQKSLWNDINDPVFD